MPTDFNNAAFGRLNERKTEMGEATQEVRSGYAKYHDYENADRERVAEMKRLVTTSGGVVRRSIANEDEGEALVSFAGIPQEKAGCFQKEAECNGWEIDWRD